MPVKRGREWRRNKLHHSDSIICAAFFTSLSLSLPTPINHMGQAFPCYSRFATIFSRSNLRYPARVFPDQFSRRASPDHHWFGRALKQCNFHENARAPDHLYILSFVDLVHFLSYFRVFFLFLSGYFRKIVKKIDIFFRQWRGMHDRPPAEHTERALWDAPSTNWQVDLWSLFWQCYTLFLYLHLINHRISASAESKETLLKLGLFFVAFFLLRQGRLVSHVKLLTSLWLSFFFPHR